MSKKVVTMGEIMLRLSTPNNEKFIQADEFDINYGGGEANVAVSLANYGHEAQFVTAVPDNELGECAVAALRKYNVGTQNIARCGERLGIYYLESGSSMRPSKVVYDRAHSSISTATAADFDFDKIFEGVDWFHFTGITPAISDSAAVLTEEALKAAKKHGVKVSVDLNFRKKLWSSEKAQKVMKNLMQYVDVCIANEDDAIGIFSMNPADANGEEKNAYIAKELMKKFPFKMVASVWRTETSITTFKLQSMIYTEGKAYYSKEFFMHILDYIGAGDAYCAGLIYSLINNFDPQKAVEFSNAASCLKHTVSGDYNLVTVDEVMKLAFSDAGNEVQR